MDHGGWNETLTFLFTDIEGSSEKWERSPKQMAEAIAAHDAVSRTEVEVHGGRLIKTTGDGVYAAFGDATDCIAAAIAIQQVMADPAATAGVPLLVRCGLHAGAAQQRNDEFFGGTINRAARIMRLAYGGQVLISQSVAALAKDRLPATSFLRDLGEVRLGGMASTERVYQLVHPGLRGDFPALRSLESPPNNLPQHRTSFIGRTKEIAEVNQLLSRARLLTLTGAGGCGKTRLALQVASHVLEFYPDGIWFIELAPLADPALVTRQVASALRLKEEPARSLMETLARHLMPRKLQLVLDNAEHLLMATAQLVDAVLRDCPWIEILVTSREPLGIAGELTYRVPSLPIPDPNRDTHPDQLAYYESAQLFVERAQFHKPKFEATEENARALASVCARLDGIPLALELAAARVRSLSVQEINQRLDDRFRLLTGGSRTVLPRQQTLRSLIDWSYDLLSDAEQVLLCRLAIFAGGWTLEAVERICSDNDIEEAKVLELLSFLVDKSLIVVEERNGASRYRMLETVRQYARDRLLERGDGVTWRDRHVAYFLDLAERAEPHIFDSEQGAWLDRLNADHENLRAALMWAADSDGNSTNGLRLCAALMRFWRTLGYYGEGRAALAKGLVASSETIPGTIRAKALWAAGTLAMDQGDAAAAMLTFDECLASSIKLSDRKRIGDALHGLAYVAYQQGDIARCRVLQEEVLAIRREVGDRAGIFGALHNLGNTLIDVGDRQTGRAYLEESLAISRELGDSNGAAWALINLGLADLDEDDHRSALVRIREGLRTLHGFADRRGVAVALVSNAHVAFKMNLAGESVRLYGAAQRVMDEIGYALPTSGERSRRQTELAGARATLGDSAYEQAWQEGQTATLEQAVQLALNFVDEGLSPGFSVAIRA